ncbi:CobW family GTP-binding protein [Streptomyces albireticuli]|uniref:Cobalamin biosynthesis protein CobW n=1 Tax=Streptomyces albireticuli TaxID=1940 RepID=A0A2A2DGC3_9ACTN|nr:GTP-binding protein [Streptomyces albireticuli]MCD9145236.1 GTP-binding protein [Streptomyces albireticuli]MCD9164589.1 GTP-binding protein [Streptomyces albireticuli]MCD9194854.1 GTP-binding protein [Streptomyces albireticuli]PAU50497.1 cobalamin biosynthesis protein CobW [Streptomyces albireticuli]
MSADPLSVVLVGGLHADARRTAVDRLLHTVPGSVALHHDLSAAAAGTVHRTVRDRSGTLDEGEAPLVDDCACCALREDLVPELERLAVGGGCRLAVVELWDSVEPKAMAEVVAAHGGERVRLTGVVTAVDPALVLPALGCGDDLAEAGLQAAATDRRTVADTFARQLEYANVLALVTDTATTRPGAPSDEEPTAFGTPVEPADAVDFALLDQLVPTARRIPAESVDLAAAAVAGFDVEAAADRQHPACALLPQEADADGVTTLVWKERRPFHPGRLYAALEDLTCAAARSRGRFWLADRPDTLLAWDAAGGALCVEGAGPWLAALPDAAWEMVPASRRVAASLDWHPEHGDRTQHLTFTSPGLDRDGLCALLESCLLTDAEYEAGPDAWRLLSTAFDTLLDPVS